MSLNLCHFKICSYIFLDSYFPIKSAPAGDWPPETGTALVNRGRLVNPMLCWELTACCSDSQLLALASSYRRDDTGEERGQEEGGEGGGERSRRTPERV